MTHPFPTRRSSDLVLFDLVGGLRHVVPVQLAPQRGEEAVAGRVDEAYCILRPAHFDAVAGLAVGPGLHVEVNAGAGFDPAQGRSEEHTSELQSLMRISYAVFCLKKKKQKIS